MITAGIELMDIERHCEAKIYATLKDRSLGGCTRGSLLLMGPKDCGEKELIQRLAARSKLLHIDLSTNPLPSARYLQSLRGIVAISSAHKAPDILHGLLRYIEDLHEYRLAHKSADLYSSNVQFILISQIDVRQFPWWRDFYNITIIHYYSLSMLELFGGQPDPLFAAISNSDYIIPTESRPPPAGFEFEIAKGGYPDCVPSHLVKDLPTRAHHILNRIYHSYLAQRVPELSEESYFRLLRKIASLSDEYTTMPALAQSCAMDKSLLDRTLGHLERCFILQRVSQWIHATSIIKIYFLDTGLFTYLSGSTKEKFIADQSWRLKLYKQFVYTELLKISCGQKGKYYVSLVDKKCSKRLDFIFSRIEDDGVHQACPVVVTTGNLNKAWEMKDHLMEFRHQYSTEVRLSFVFYPGAELVYLDDEVYAVPFHQVGQFDVEPFELTSWHLRFRKDAHHWEPPLETSQAPGITLKFIPSDEPD